MVELNIMEILSGLICISSIMVISATNPVHSALCLILTFVNASGLLFLLELEFVSFIFIVVYVGAIAVLFLFIVMMLDIKTLNSSGTTNGVIWFCLLNNFSIYDGNWPFSEETPTHII